MKIRKQHQYIFETIISIGLLLFAFYKFQFSNEQHKVGVEIFISIILIFGLLVKIILGSIFPEIILDEKGLKIIGRSKIFWKEIKQIIVKNNGIDSVTVIIEKSNSKKITENFKNLNLSEFELNSTLQFYLEKFGFKF